MRSFSLRDPHFASPLLSVRALMTHRFIFRFAFAGANIFAWVLIFQYFFLVESNVAYGLARTALLYALSQVITALVTPYAARLLRFGTRRLFLSAIILAASAFVVLGATFAGFWGATYTSAALSLFAICLGLYRALYWIPYEIELQVNGTSRGNQFKEFLIAFAPILGGFCIVAASFGPLWLLFSAVFLILLSATPLLYLPDIRERFSWGYRETFGHLVEPAHRGIVIPALLEGVSGTALLLFWPLAVFMVMGWSYGMLGIVLSVTFIITIFMRTLVRKGLRRAGLHTSTSLKVLFSVTPWILRGFVGTPLGVIAVDSYFYTTTPRRFGLDPLAFEQTADAGSYIDEYTALKEMSLAIGRIMLCIIGAIAAFTLPLPAVFVLVFLCAACASATSVILAKNSHSFL